MIDRLPSCTEVIFYFFDAHTSGLHLLEAEHSNAISAKLASALSSLRQVLGSQAIFPCIFSVIRFCQDFARDDKKGKLGAGGLVDGLVKKRQQLLLNRDIVRVSKWFHMQCR